jgi:hypothetical protein
MSDNAFTNPEFSSWADIPDMELLPAGQYNAECVKVESALSQKGLPRLALTLRIDPENFPIDYDLDNAPLGATVVCYAANISFGYDPSKPWRTGVTAIRNVFKAFGASFDKLVSPAECAPREALGGHCFVSDEALKTLEGRVTRATVRHGKNLSGEDQLQVSNISPVD